MARRRMYSKQVALFEICVSDLSLRHTQGKMLLVTGTHQYTNIVDGIISVVVEVIYGCRCCVLETESLCVWSVVWSYSTIVCNSHSWQPKTASDVSEAVCCHTIATKQFGAILLLIAGDSTGLICDLCCDTRLFLYYIL